MLKHSKGRISGSVDIYIVQFIIVHMGFAVCRHALTDFVAGLFSFCSNYNINAVKWLNVEPFNQLTN